MKYIGVFSALFHICTFVLASHDSDHPLSADEWKEVMGKVVLLEDSGLVPTLLPTIMRNRDMLELTDEQWEKFNFVVADIPKLASLASQVNTVNLQHIH